MATITQHIQKNSLKCDLNNSTYNQNDIKYKQNDQIFSWNKYELFTASNKSNYHLK